MLHAYSSASNYVAQPCPMAGEKKKSRRLPSTLPTLIKTRKFPTSLKDKISSPVTPRVLKIGKKVADEIKNDILRL